MKNGSVILLLQLACLTGAFAQSSGISKPLIDTGVYGSWPSVSMAFGSSVISHDGKYVIYMVNNRPVGSNTLVIQSTDAKWKKEFPGLSGASFTPDSKYAIYKNTGDSLVMLALGRSAVAYIPKVQMYSLPESGDWWVYQPHSPAKELVARNSRTGKQRTFSSVSNYWLSDDSKTLFIQTVVTNSSTALQKLSHISLQTGRQTTIWEGAGLTNPVFDKKNNLAFTTRADGESEKKMIWYYTAGMKAARSVTDTAFFENNKSMQIDKVSRFSKNGKRLFVLLREDKTFEAKSPVNRNGVHVTIWSYTDAVLPTMQSENKSGLASFGTVKKECLAVLDPEKNKLIRLEQEPGELDYRKSDDLFLTRTLKPGADSYEQYWNRAITKPPYLVSASDGSRKDLSVLNGAQQPDVSPTGKYLLYWNPEQQNFFTYEAATGSIKNITKSISTTWLNYKDDHVRAGPAWPPGWLANDEWVLLYDQFDLWRVDPAGNRAPVNLTNGYGRLHEIIFRMAINSNEGRGSSNVIVPDQGKLLLNAFNWKTKENGFYSINLNKKGDPALLTMGDYIYENKVAANFISGMSPVKARDAERYLVKRMSASEFPNLFSTTDFKTFTPLTDLHPEKAFNWMTTELHTWTGGKGDTIQGVLYKPENFDPNKKYPLIFYYYERFSHSLNQYLEPKAGQGMFEIPWYVSHGYLVFCPDIHITTGEPGESAVNSVVSAAKYLSQKPFVNADKMGLTGFSYGGFETYYLITHSNLFAAACAGAGFTNFISDYGSIHGHGFSMQTVFEKGQVRMGGTLWEIPDLYIKNSPVLKADRVTTPVLMYHNTHDGAVPFAQAMEFYQAMRRLGKRAWLLEYADGDHQMPGPSGIDCSIRMMQFFDHYLKDEPAPQWMMPGNIPLKMRSVENEFDLIKEKDENGRYITPGKGLNSK